MNDLRSPLAPLFDTAVFSCQLGWVKPEKEIYEVCMSKLQISPNECVFVGDGGMGELEGARQLGINSLSRPDTLSCFTQSPNKSLPSRKTL